MNKIEEQADHLLAMIGDQERERAAVEARAAKEIQEITARYAEHLDRLDASLEANRKGLIALMKKHKATLFDGRDEVSLTAGILLYGTERKVSIPRDALAKARELGYDDAIWVTESLDRSVVEGWPIERIFMIGGKRRLVESFDWELFEERGGHEGAKTQR
jgi:phage host-nuclease inhibitor protein Gam